MDADMVLASYHDTKKILVHKSDIVGPSTDEQEYSSRRIELNHICCNWLLISEKKLK